MWEMWGWILKAPDTESVSSLCVAAPIKCHWNVIFTSTCRCETTSPQRSSDSTSLSLILCCNQSLFNLTHCMITLCSMKQFKTKVDRTTWTSQTSQLKRRRSCRASWGFSSSSPLMHHSFTVKSHRSSRVWGRCSLQPATCCLCESQHRAVRYSSSVNYWSRHRAGVAEFVSNMWRSDPLLRYVVHSTNRHWKWFLSSHVDKPARSERFTVSVLFLPSFFLFFLWS